MLGVEAKDLGYLEVIPSAELNQFRARCTDTLFAGDSGRLHRVATASKLVPVGLTVRISQLAFGPALCAATAGLLDPSHAVKIASKVPTPFLADIAVHLDPRRAAEVISAIPSEIVVRVAVELIQRGEYVTMGRFVNFLPLATLRAAVPRIEDEADLLRVAFVMEGKSSLDDLLDIARSRVQKLIDAAHTHDMWAEALDLIGNLSLDNRAELADVAASQDPIVLDALIQAAHRLGMWDALLPVVAVMSPDSLARFAEIPAVLDPEVLDGIVTAALDGDLWLDLLPLSTALPEQGLRLVAARAAAEDDETLSHLATQAHEAEQWDALLPIALAFDDDARRRLAHLPLLARADVLQAAIGTAARHDLWDAVLPLAEVLPEEVKPTIAAAIGDLTRDQILAALDAAARSDNLPVLVDIALRQEPAGRQRVLDIVAEQDRLEDFAQLLVASTPDLIWDALIEVRAEMQAVIRTVVVDRAAELGRPDVVARLNTPA